jgi:cellulose biosynthesis protein BcsQ
MKKTVLVAMSNQKGGVGKSTVSVCLATYLHCVMGKNILILDCDEHQHSLVNMRQRDITAVERSNDYKHLILDQYKRTRRKAYPIIEATAENALEEIARIKEENPGYYDVILVDLPGSITSNGVLRTIVNMDYAIAPVIADRMVMQSTLTFATAVLDYCKLHKGFPLKEFLFFWNKVDRRASTEVFNIYVKILERLELHVLDTAIPESRRFDKELSLVGKPYFRSTLLPPPAKLLKGSNVDLLAEEFCKLLNI